MPPDIFPVGRHAKPGSGGVSRLSVDGDQATEARIPRTHPYRYSTDEGIDVGIDNETPVTPAYRERHNRFTGTIRQVTVARKQ